SQAGFGSTPATGFGGQPSSGFTGETACASTCSADQANATTDGHGADFQALLTCIGNAQGASPLCLPLACGLTDAFGTPPVCGASDAGGDVTTTGPAGACAAPPADTCLLCNGSWYCNSGEAVV